MNEQYENMKIETAIERLSEVVELMEREDIELNELINLYEDACKLIITCHRQLNDVNDKIVKLDERIAEFCPDYEELLNASVESDDPDEDIQDDEADNDEEEYEFDEYEEYDGSAEPKGSED